MKVTRAKLDGLLLVEPDVFEDARGCFLEVWNLRRYTEAGLPEVYVQDNLSRSCGGVVRGLHLQHPHGQGKLVQVVSGEVFDVAVDVRVGSPTFGQWEGFVLSGQNHHQLYLPPGFAHGFCVTSEHALFSYKCTELYHREGELGVAWNDPDLAIDWPVREPSLSAKDTEHPRLAEIPAERLPRWA